MEQNDKKQRKIDRKATFSLLVEKKRTLIFEEIDQHSDHYWLSACEHFEVNPVYQEQLVLVA